MGKGCVLNILHCPQKEWQLAGRFRPKIPEQVSETTLIQNGDFEIYHGISQATVNRMDS